MALSIQPQNSVKNLFASQSAFASLLAPALFRAQCDSTIPPKVGPPAVNGFEVNPKSVSNFLTGFPLLMQNMGAAAQFGLCFLVE